jgi:hypothetical protein
MKRFFYFLVFVNLTIISYSQVVSQEKADILAQNFYAERLFLETGSSNFNFEPLPVIIYSNEDPAIYVYVCADRPGYIMVSAEYSAYPVFGYSFESGFDEAMTVPVFRDMLDEFTQQIEFARTNKIQSTEDISGEWQKYSNPNFDKSGKDLKNLSPIVHTSWNQGCYYNDLCPEDIQGPCGKVWAGCVATAMGQVMKYHNWPPQGQGNNIYLTQGGYGTLSANFGDAVYDWNNMPATLNDLTDNYEIARLLLHCGISVNMDYSWDGSGANTYKAGTSLVEYFKYADYAVQMEKDYFTNELWSEILRVELHSGRPLLYRGYGSGGHAFVCDGYQGALFHFNLGWGGSANGFYSLSNVAGFAQDQAAIFGVEPKYTGPQYCDSYTLLTAKSGAFSDGSNDKRYANNTNCQWLIQPQDAGAIVLSFNYLNTEPGSDRILVYEGDSENGWLIADISGFNVPADPIVVSGGSMFVWFMSDELNAASGWEAEYTIWATDIQEPQSVNVQITPNPASETINIQLDNEYSGEVLLVFSDINGKQILSSTETITKGRIDKDVSKFAQGIYLVEVSGNSLPAVSGKIVIRH